MNVKFVHRSKALSPIEVTPNGIVTDVKPLHPAKAPDPVKLTLDGIINDKL